MAGAQPTLRDAAPGCRRRRRRSKDISLGLVIFVSGALLSCGPTDTRRCVDQNGLVVEDERCEWTSSGPGAVPMHHWYYGGTGLHIGQRVGGGSFTPHAGVRYHSSVSRGGFGHSASVHGVGGA